MTRWEYCYVSIGWRAGLTGNYIAYIDYLGTTGSVRFEELATPVSKSKKDPIQAIGCAFAKLGQEGWELVTLQRETRESGFSNDCAAILKRPIL